MSLGNAANVGIVPFVRRCDCGTQKALETLTVLRSNLSIFVVEEAMRGPRLS